MKTWHWFVGLVLVGVLLRVLLLGGYEPQSFPDTGTYTQAARDLLSGDFTLGQGRRTPGYPLVIAIVGESPRALMLANMGFGLLTAALLFFITRRLTGHAGLAFAVGLGTYTINLQQLFQEGALVTETLSTLSVAAVVAAFLVTLKRLREGRPAALWSVLLAVLSGYAILVRPQFVFLPLVLPVLLVYAVSGLRWPSVSTGSAGLLAALPAIAMLIGWSAVIHAKVGPFTLSTQSGFGMVNHPIDYIELAPERYAKVRDVLVKTRDERIKEVGHSRNTIWYAWPEIQRVTGWSLPEASREFQRMCTEMFIAHPGRYAISVAHAWVDFWTVPIFWRTEAIQPPALRAPLEASWSVEHVLLRLANLVFVVMVLVVAVSARARRWVGWDIGMSAIAATVLLSSLVQALFDQGASSRYAIPTQSLVVLALVVAWARVRGRVLPA